MSKVRKKSSGDRLMIDEIGFWTAYGIFLNAFRAGFPRNDRAFRTGDEALVRLVTIVLPRYPRTITTARAWTSFGENLAEAQGKEVWRCFFSRGVALQVYLRKAWRLSIIGIISTCIL